MNNYNGKEPISWDTLKSQHVEPTPANLAQFERKVPKSSHQSISTNSTNRNETTSNRTGFYLDERSSKKFNKADLEKKCKNTLLSVTLTAGMAGLILFPTIHWLNEPLPDYDTQNYGAVYTDENGFTEFESIEELRKYCDENGYSFDLLTYTVDVDTDGIIRVANSSFIEKPTALSALENIAEDAKGRNL